MTRREDEGGAASACQWCGASNEWIVFSVSDIKEVFLLSWEILFEWSVVLKVQLQEHDYRTSSNLILLLASTFKAEPYVTANHAPFIYGAFPHIRYILGPLS